LGDDEEYIDELYNHEEENMSSDESVASAYNDHKDNDASMGDGEKIDEMMVEQVVLSEKCANTETMDGIDGIVAEGMFTDCYKWFAE